MIYIVYKDGAILYPTTLPRIVQNAFKEGADRVEIWRNEKLLKSTASANAFNKIINPSVGEDIETGGGDYEW